MSNPDNPSFIIKFADGEYEANRGNTTLYTHIGSLACYDNVTIVTDPDNNSGRCIFACQEGTFEDLADYLITHDFPLHMNLQEVNEADVNAFNDMVHRQAEAEEYTIPDDWLNESE